MSTSFQNGTRYTRPKVKDEMKPELKMKKLSSGTRYIRPEVKDEIKPELKIHPSKAQRWDKT